METGHESWKGGSRLLTQMPLSAEDYVDLEVPTGRKLLFRETLFLLVAAGAAESERFRLFELATVPWWLRRLSVCLQCGRPGFNPWVGKIPWRRKWQSTPVLLPGESHGQRSLIGYSPWGRKESDTTERLHLPSATLLVFPWSFPLSRIKSL